MPTSVPAPRTLVTCTVTLLVVRPGPAGQPRFLHQSHNRGHVLRGVTRPRDARLEPCADLGPSGRTHASGQLLRSTKPNAESVPDSNGRTHAERGWAPGEPGVPGPASGWQGSGTRCFTATEPAVSPVLCTQKTPPTCFLKKRGKKGSLERGGGDGEGEGKGGSPRRPRAAEKRDTDAATSQREFPPGPRETTGILPLSTPQTGISWGPTWHAGPDEGTRPRLHRWWPRATCPHTRPLPPPPGGPLPARARCCSSVRGCAQNQGKARHLLGDTTGHTGDTSGSCRGCLLGAAGHVLPDTRRPATPGRQSQDGGRRPRASGPWAPRTPRHLSSAPLSARAGFLSLISNIPDGDTDLNHSGHNLLSKQPSNNSPRRPRAPSTWVTVCLHCDLSQTNTPNISCPCAVSPNVCVAQNTSLAHSLR